jgi:hypothetical protein
MQRSLTAVMRRRGAIFALATTCPLLVGAAAWSRAVASPEPPGQSAKTPFDLPTATHPPLRILWDQEMLSDLSPAMDVRWASDRSIYVAWLRHGASELALDGKFTVIRNLFPDARTAKYQPFDFLAVSNDYVVASSNARTLGFRPRPHGKPEGVANVLITRASVGNVEAIDISGDRLVLVGLPDAWVTGSAGVAISAKARGAYLNRHRVLDGILPLRQGPGLIIRSVAESKVHWQLVVLRAAGTVVYDIPLTGTLPYDRLRGDVLGSRIVLLLGPHEFDKFEKDQPHAYKTTHLYVTELPPVIEPLAPTDQERGRS